MEMKRVKINCGGKVDEETNTMAEDRISQLPNPLIHHIFSFIPTIYIVRMSILSQCWRYMWLSTPFIYFDFDDSTCTCTVRKRVMFLNFVTNSLRCRKLYMQVPESSKTTFKCCMSCTFASSGTRQVDDWLSFDVRMKVKELDLCGNHHCLPQFVLSARSLTVLKLRYMKLEASSLSNFPSLKVLSLTRVEFDSKSLQNLVSGCPIIEDLHLEENIVGDIDLDVSGTLKSLSLLYLKINDQWLDRLISRLPLHEILTFKCNQLTNISICSHSLKYLSCAVFSINKADLRTPNLVCLHFACHAKSDILVEAPKLLEATLSLYNCSMFKASYLGLVHLLSNLNFLKKLTLTIEWQWKSIKKKSLPPLPNLKHLKVKINGRLTRNSQLRESLLWCAPSVETLEIC